jgi:valacyclovir hydrolase
MPSFRHDGQEINYEESGQGQPVLLMPGWGGTIGEFASLGKKLESRYRVIAADLPGSGKSAPQPRSYPATYYHDDARSMLALLKALKVSPAHLVGFSDGGEYALVMAATEPAAVRSVVTWGAAGLLPHAPEMAEMMADLIDAPIPPMKEFADYMKASYGEANAREMCRSLASATLAIMDDGGDISRSRANQIVCPALLITGEHDFLATPSLVRDMASAITGGEFLEAQAAGHAIHHEQGEWLTATIFDWLARH